MVKEKGVSGLVVSTGTSPIARTMSRPVEIYTRINSALGTKATGFAPRKREYVTAASMTNPALRVMSSAMWGSRIGVQRI